MVEDGLQKQMKTAVTFVDLTATFDAVWKKALISKLLSLHDN